MINLYNAKIAICKKKKELEFPSLPRINFGEMFRWHFVA